MKKILLSLILIIIAVCSFSETKTIFYEDVIYKKTDVKDLHLDIKYIDNGKPKPCVFLVHGGSWTGGNKKDMQWIGDRFVNEGYVSVSVQYRFMQEKPTPACVEDCKTAVRFIREKAKKYQIDKNHIVAIGFSAGGHLASMLGVLPEDLCKDDLYKNQSSRVQGVINLCGPCSFEMREPVGFIYSKAIQTHLCKDDASLIKLCNPYNHIDKTSAPFMLFFGGKDTLVIPEQCDSFVKKMNDNGVYCYLHIEKDAGHGYDIFQFSDDIYKFMRDIVGAKPAL